MYPHVSKRLVRAISAAGLTATLGVGAVSAPAVSAALTAGAESGSQRTTASVMASGFVVRDAAYPGIYVDANGSAWAPGGGFDGSARSMNRPGAAIAGTDDDALFAHQHFGMRSWSTLVPRPGEYRVRLRMAEMYWDKPGARVFDVRAEGVLAADDVDIVKAVGPRTAHTVEFTSTVTDGRLDLAFAATADNPLVAAVEVTPAAYAPTDPTVRWAARPDALIDTSGAWWRPMSGMTGAVSMTKPSDKQVAETEDDELYRRQMFGMSGWSMPVSAPGTYRVRIDTTDLWATRTGQRVFDVRAEGTTLVNDLDIVAEVGPATAYATTFEVNVADGVLDLEFAPSVDNAIVSAISVSPPAESGAEPTPAPTPTPSPSATPTPTPTTEPTPRPTTEPIEDPQTQPGQFVSRMVASPRPVTDSSGNVWSRWSGTLGTLSMDQQLVGTDITGTDEDVLYQSNVWDARGYAVNVPGDGTYRVRLLMAESTFWHPGKRVFDVKAEGAVAKEGIDVAAAVGPLAAYDVTFDVAVNDGVLDLDFVKRVDNPMISAIEVTSVGEITPDDTVARSRIPVYPGSVYRQDISSAPVAANGKAVGQYIATAAASRYGGYAGFNAYDFAAAIHTAGPGTERVDIVHSCAVPWGVPPNLFDGYGHFVGVPVPEDAQPAAGSDGQMTIYDPASDQLWEFWQMRRSATTGAWEACWGGRIDAFSTKEAIFPDGFGASASGLAVAPGAVTLDDVRRGRIDHALTLVVPGPYAGGFSWPANRTDGTSWDPNAPREGQRLRLPADLDLDAYNLTPIGRSIAEAAQKYGFIVTDNGGSVAVSGESGLGIRNATGRNPWGRYLGDFAWATMRAFPWSKLEALPVDYGKPHN